MAVRHARLPARLLAPVLLSAILSTGYVDGALSQTDPAKIVGPNACAECHKEETELWKKTHHFTTFKALPRSKEAREIADKLKIKRIKAESLCLNCHFTSRPRGRNVRPIAGISCESCHSAGKAWEKLHSGFSGKTEKTESKSEAKARWKKVEALGMIRPHALYKVAKNCYGCHVVPQEKLVNVGGHPAGSAFELVSWSQGEVRHNVWHSKGKSNAVASAKRRRMMYIVGLAVELETALRAVSRATRRKTFAFRMARRADQARKKLAEVAKAAPGVPELANIVKLGHSAGLRLRNGAALSAAADKIANETLRLAAKTDGSALADVDRLVPSADKYKGKPSR